MRRWLTEKILEAGYSMDNRALSWLEENNERTLSKMGYHDKNFGVPGPILGEVPSGEEGSYALTQKDPEIAKVKRVAASNVLWAYAEGYTSGAADCENANADKLQDYLRAIAINNPSLKFMEYGAVEDLIRQQLYRCYPES